MRILRITSARFAAVASALYLLGRLLNAHGIAFIFASIDATLFLYMLMANGIFLICSLLHRYAWYKIGALILLFILWMLSVLMQDEYYVIQRANYSESPMRTNRVIEIYTAMSYGYSYTIAPALFSVFYLADEAIICQVIYSDGFCSGAEWIDEYEVRLGDQSITFPRSTEK